MRKFDYFLYSKVFCIFLLSSVPVGLKFDHFHHYCDSIQNVHAKM